MATMGFEIVPDSGQTRMRVWGRGFEEVFRAALRGIAYVMRPPFFDAKKRALSATQEVRAEAVDIHSLLIEFLMRVLSHSSDARALFPEVSFTHFSDDQLQGELRGAPVEEFEKDIKAVSYHEVDIKRNPETGLFETTLVFEI